MVSVNYFVVLLVHLTNTLQKERKNLSFFLEKCHCLSSVIKMKITTD